MSSTDFLAPRKDPWVHLPPLPPPPANHEKQQTPSGHQKPKRRFPRRSLWAVAGICVSGFVLFLSLGFVQIVSGALSLRVAAQESETALEEGDLGLAKDALAHVLRSLKTLHRGLSFFAFLKPVPWLGDQVKGADATLDAAIETTEVVQTGLVIFLDALDAVEGAGGIVGVGNGSGEDRSYSSLTDEEKYILLQSLASALPELRKMQVKLRLATHDLERLEELDLAPAVKTAIAPLREKLPELVTAVDVIVPFAAIAPEYAGLGKDRQFLLLFLNNDEIRPGGGFIGVYGLMLVRNGDMVNLSTDDSYNVDAFVQGDPSYFVTPPSALREYLIPEWYFRDSAWSPDFAQTARDASQLFRQEIAWSGQPVPEIHGVVGITPSFIARLLDFVGPVTVDGQTFTSENIAEQLEYQVEQAYAVDGVPEHQRKEIVSQVTDEVVDRVMSISPRDWPEFFEILHAGFAQKEMALMSFDNRTQAALEDAGWSGVLNPAASDDLVMVVDANLAALKSDPLVDRHINYSIKPNGKGYRATTSITYKHNGTKYDWRTTRYRTYTRIFVPYGSKIVSSSGSLKNDRTKNPSLEPDTVDVVDDLGMTSFGSFTAVELGETRTLSFTYDLPQNVVDAINRGDYELQAFKQVGARDNLLTLDLDFGNTVKSAEPAEAREDWGDAVYHFETTLETDKEFRVRL